MPEIEANGVSFQVAVHGHGDPLVLLHGFTGSSRSWWPVRDRLAERHQVTAIDLIGHGASAAPASPGRYGFDLAVDDLAAIAGALQIGPAAWLGYSMGGRLALALALRHPDVVSTLILESATPGIAYGGEREARRRADDMLATTIETGGVGEFVADWERLPLWTSQRALPVETLSRQREIRLANRARGLAHSLRGMGQGAQPSLWKRLGAVAIPVLAIAGGEDGKFARIATEMAAAMPAATLSVIPDAGHAVHLERPDLYADLVLAFLTRDEALVSALPEERRRHQAGRGHAKRHELGELGELPGAQAL